MDLRMTESLTPEDLQSIRELGVNVDDPLFRFGPSWDDPNDPPEVRFARIEEDLQGVAPDVRNLLLESVARELGVPYTPAPEHGNEPKRQGKR